MIHLEKGGQESFPVYQNLSVIMSSMYLGEKVNKFLQAVENDFSSPTTIRKALFNKDIGENTAIAKYFVDATESDEEEQDYYFSNSD